MMPQAKCFGSILSPLLVIICHYKGCIPCEEKRIALVKRAKLLLTTTTKRGLLLQEQLQLERLGEL